MGHIHAELMAQYAEDAKQHDRPWELWQHGDHEVWVGCTYNPAWFTDHSYRRKPQTIMLGEYEVPEPCREVPETGQKVWAIHPINRVEPFTWYNSKACHDALESGFVHLTEEAAEKHYEAFKNLLAKK